MRLLWGLTHTFIVMTIIAIDTFITSIYVIIKYSFIFISFIINSLAKMGCKNGK